MPTTTPLTVTEDATISAGTVISSSAEYTVIVQPGDEPVTLVNDGEVQNSGDYGLGIYVDAYSPVTVINNGTVDVLSHTTGGQGVDVGAVGSLLNYGHIVVRADRAADPNNGLLAGQAWGVMGNSIFNAGVIEVSSTYGEAIGVFASHHVVNSGTISVTGGTDIGWVYGIRADLTGLYVENSGTIEVTSTGGTPAVGISIFANNSNVYQYGTVINSGTITAEIAISAIEGYSGGTQVTNSGQINGDLLFDKNMNVVTNAAHGVWNGNLTFGLDQDALVNAGTINGSVNLGAGEDFFDGRGGTVSGTVNGGAGRDFLIGGGGADRIDGGDGNDRIQGGDGGDTLTGGTGADVLSTRP